MMVIISRDMNQFKIKLICYFFGFLFLAKTTNQETLKDDANMTKERAAASIGKIQPDQILPIILLMNPKDFTLHVPNKIEKIETNDKRIINGSDFSSEHFQQLFFCPNEAPEKNCLAPRTFDKLEPLQCTKQATPIFKKLPTGSNQCGIDNSGILYEVVYEICPAQEPYKYETNNLKLYELCYDADRKIILYARHKILSYKLLNSKLLFREREMEYQMMKNVDLPLSNYEALEHASHKERKSEYKLQKLTPSETMTFASWKKTTYEYVNVALQHHLMYDFWNDLNIYVQNNADTLHYFPNNYIYSHSENSIYDGVLYDPSSTSGDNGVKEPKVWFKVIHTETSEPYEQGIVILMNNFLIFKSDQETQTNSHETKLEDYCKESVCPEEFEGQFEPFGKIRCCRWNANIAKLLGIPYDDKIVYHLLPLKDVTYYVPENETNFNVSRIL